MFEMLDLSKIQEELEKARYALREVEEAIHKVEGTTFTNGPARFGANKVETKTRFSTVQEGPRLASNDLSFNLKRGPREKRDGIASKMRSGEVRPQGVFSRLSGLPRPKAAEDDDEEFSSKPVLPSRVFATPSEAPSRQEVIASQTVDAQSKERNKRMFGALLGTLQRFRREETQVKEREEKRLKVEKKLEENAKREKEQLLQEKHELLTKRKKKESEIKRIEWSLNRVKEFVAWETNIVSCKNFIQTQTKPHLFYLPRTHTPKTEERLANTKKVIDKMVQKRLTSLKEEIYNSDKKAKKGLLDDQDEMDEVMDVQGDENHQPETEEMDVDLENVDKENHFQEPEGDLTMENGSILEDTGKSEEWVEKEQEYKNDIDTKTDEESCNDKDQVIEESEDTCTKKQLNEEEHNESGCDDEKADCKEEERKTDAECLNEIEPETVTRPEDLADIVPPADEPKQVKPIRWDKREENSLDDIKLPTEPENIEKRLFKVSEIGATEDIMKNKTLDESRDSTDEVKNTKDEVVGKLSNKASNERDSSKSKEREKEKKTSDVKKKSSVKDDKKSKALKSSTPERRRRSRSRSTRRRPSKRSPVRSSRRSRSPQRREKRRSRYRSPRRRLNKNRSRSRSYVRKSRRSISKSRSRSPVKRTRKSRSVSPKRSNKTKDGSDKSKQRIKNKRDSSSSSKSPTPKKVVRRTRGSSSSAYSSSSDSD